MTTSDLSKGLKKAQSVAYTSPSLFEGLRNDLRAILDKDDFSLEELRKILGDFIDESPDRYSFSWSGKQSAISSLQQRSTATLIPDFEASINFDTTQNLFIEGDNLEVLKLLYKPYCGQIKMIYIDPPYNTGNDFIYPDNFTDSLNTYLTLSGQKDSNGNLLTSNPETNGRYHSAWLTMMYPRLFAARQLLSEEGVIFVSIDDNEVHNLRMIMNEIFGEENFVAQITWEKRSGPPNDRIIGSVHEYIVVYAKSSSSLYLQLLPRENESKDRYTNPDNDPKGPWAPGDLSANAKGGRFVASLYFEIENPRTGQKHLPPEGACWRFNREKIQHFISEGKIFFGLDDRGRPKIKRYLSEVRNGLTVPTIWKDLATNTHARTEIRELFGESNIFETPKPVALLKRIIEIGMTDDGIALDFFAGSCATAQAVLEMNHKDGGHRRFIMVQLPEPTRNRNFPTIADVGMERIRRVITKLQGEGEGKLPLGNETEDLGFRVFKLSKSNYRVWTSEGINDQESYIHALELFVETLLDGWKVQDVLWEVTIKEGLNLSSCVEKREDILTNNVWRVLDRDRKQVFHLCLDDTLQLTTIDILALTRNDLFICRDSALDDTLAANLALQCRLKTV
jgi:adenine-specific DNA-methyltransferase